MFTPITKTLLRGLAILACAAALTWPARADEITAGRAIATKWQDTLVTVKIAAKMRMSFMGQDNAQEHKAEAIGTVIDPSGLIIVSLTNTDPTEAVSKMIGTEEMKGMTLSTEITDLQIRFADGLELPAKFVMRDKDLDLAFLRLVKPPAAPLAALDLSKTSDVGLLDNVIVLSRMGAVANRTVSVALDRIEAVVEKPRKFFVPGGSGNDPQLGSPVFALDGSFVGIQLLRAPVVVKGSEENAPLLVILPAADIEKAAKAAPKTADAAITEPVKPPTKPAPKTTTPAGTTPKK